jgi:hypothetical protein
MDNPIKTEKEEPQDKEKKTFAIKFFLPPEVEVLLPGLILTSIIVGNLPNC